MKAFRCVRPIKCSPWRHFVSAANFVVVYFIYVPKKVVTTDINVLYLHYENYISLGFRRDN